MSSTEGMCEPNLFNVSVHTALAFHTVNVATQILMM